MSSHSDISIRVEREYFPDGALKSETHYRGASCHGPWRQWHSNGVLAREFHYEKHVFADGVHRTWHSNGQVESEMTYRDGKCVRLVSFDQRGRPVPSSYDKMLLDFQKFVERTVRRAKRSRPLAKLKKVQPATEESERAFVAELLDGEVRSARHWLAEATDSHSRTLGELDVRTSRVLVDALHEIGAVDVLAVRIEGDSNDSTTNHILVTLPEDPQARAAVFAFVSAHARREGFEGGVDYGQELLYMKLC